MGKALTLAVAAVGTALLARKLRRGASLRGRVVLVTGGSRGLGLVLARELVRKGARIAICARDERELVRAQDDLAARGGEVLAVVCDLRIPSAAERLVETVIAHYGRLDVLINNAGIIEVGPAGAMSLQDYRSVMGVNFWGTVYTTLAALPHLRRSTLARIVNVTSIGAAIPVPHLLPYTCSKFALLGFSEGLAVELAPEGVRVTTVLPGMMRTGSFVNALFKGQRSREVSWFSVGAALPIASMSADRAARRILLACARGERFLTLGLPFKALRVAHALAPGISMAVLGALGRLLPALDGADPSELAEPGWLHRRGVARGPLLALGNRAARRNLEVPWASPEPG